LAGSNITLTVSAVGSVPLSYQWQQSGANLAGQTNSSLVLLDFLSTNAVSYDVVVTNDAGSITSSVVDVTAVAVGSSYSSLVLADGAVGYWPLDESSGTVANNLGSSGSADNGTYANGVVLGLAGPIATSSNTCAAFSATNDTDVTLPYDVLLNGQTFSVEAWAQMSGAGQAADDGYQAVYNSRATGYGGVTLYGLYGGDWLAYSGSGSAFTVMDSGVPVQVGKWAHLALTYDGVTQRFYVDGTQVATSAAPFFPDQLYAIQESIGAGGIAPAAEYFFEGNIGEVAVYSTCLPATSIQAHYTVGSTAPYVAPPTISISQSGGNVTLTWSGGALQQSTNLLNGSWSVVSNVVSPLNLEITNTASYYRVMQ